MSSSLITAIGTTLLVLPLVVFFFLMIIAIIASAIDGDLFPLTMTFFIGCPFVGALLLLYGN